MLRPESRNLPGPGTRGWRLFGYPCFRGLLLLLLTSASAAAPQSTAGRSVADVVALYQEKVEQRLKPRFDFAGIDWPPQQAALLAIKQQRRLELWAGDGERWRHIRDYRVKGMSGVAGPKLREGDDQVPEGRYTIESLNANSAFHLSMKVDYPNRSDRRQGEREGRTALGGNIFIHGKAVSRGCLAIGDNAIEELFVLAGLIGERQIRVLIAPRDFRLLPPHEAIDKQPAWVLERYRRIAADMAGFPRR